jgi:hypothetical protein
VLDVGGWASPHPRADWVIDLGSYETRGWYEWGLGAAASDEPERVSSATWVQQDICGPEPWPFSDGMFEFVICTQTLEDVRDPISACAEMMRVGKSGYVETPAAVTELTRGIQSPLWCGWNHHRWLVREENGGLVFVAKPHHIHSPHFPSVRTPRRLRPGALEPLRFVWRNSFSAREAVNVTEWEAFDRELLAIVREAARPDPLGALVRDVRRVTWSAYTHARRLAGRSHRRT